MQPYFFPYLGYFDLINRVDHWIVFDEVKYNPKSWMNRNRIMHPTKEWQYINIPIKNSENNKIIKNIYLQNPEEAKSKIISQITHYKKKRAPYFYKVIKILEDSFFDNENLSLRDLNTSALTMVCEYIGIDFTYENLSELEITLPEITYPGQWALEICKSLGARRYINPPNGREIFNDDDWRKAGIELRITNLIKFHYENMPPWHCEHLSILDVLMWNSPRHIKSYLDDIKNSY